MGYTKAQRSNRIFKRKTKQMRTILDLTIASIGCLSDNNYICAAVLVYVIYRLYQESKQYN